MDSHTALSLCAGYGGLDLGLRIARRNARTVCYVEREITAAQILAARIADGTLDDAPIWSDLTTFDGRPWRGKVDSITAGYPCQPFSAAGKRKGARDPRHLWPHVARIIREVEPAEVFIENVEGHLSLGFYEVARELRRMGYGVEAGLFSAEECGASHRRKRLFALAYRDGSGLETRDQFPRSAEAQRLACNLSAQLADRESGGRGELRESPAREGLADRRDDELENAARLLQYGRLGESGGRRRGIRAAGDELAHPGRADHWRNTDASNFEGKRASSRACGTSGNVADAERGGQQATADARERAAPHRKTSDRPTGSDLSLFAPGPADFDAWRKLLEIDPSLEPAICRGADGPTGRMDGPRSYRVDRLRALGNGVVPLTAAFAYSVLRNAIDGGCRVNSKAA